MLNELMETNESTAPRVMALRLQIHQDFLGNSGPFPRKIVLHYLADADSELHSKEPHKIYNNI